VGDSPSRDREAIRVRLVRHRYTRACFDGLNDYFVAHEHFDRLGAKFETPVNPMEVSARVADGEGAMKILIGEKVSVVAPADGGDVTERREALEVREELQMLARALEESDRELALACREFEGLKLTLEATQQSTFERERLVAWYAHELKHARAHVRLEKQHHERLAAEAAGAAEARRARIRHIRFADGLARILWRATLPLRVLRRPRFYLRLLKNR